MAVRETFRRWSTWLRLVLAGWHRNRDVWHRLHLPKAIRVFPEAKRVLSEYGNLKFGDANDRVHPDPSVGEEIAEQIDQWEKEIARSLYPLGFAEHQDRIYLLIDDEGIVYKLILDDSPGQGVDSELEPLAPSFEKALDYLVQ